jgi:Alw26I/Eco31I/Esp3I family type II restriction endonuclease
MEQPTKRSWHKKFLKYTEFIVNHSNYRGLKFERSKNGTVKWVITGKSKEGEARRAWWNKKCKENGIKIEPGCYAKIALLIHPTRKHTCQICGKELMIDYVYPNKRLINNIKKHFGVIQKPYEKDILTILDELIKGKEDISKIIEIFKISNSSKIDFNKKTLKEYISNEFIKKSSKSFLSPGVMSNSPDRLDGFHSDGNCCRPLSDKGRHKSNLSRYTQDRRVYMNWADGNWKMADRLMSLFGQCGLSADHIGPISLGFCHRPKFQPMTKEQNSTKNNRMSLNDVKMLISDEKSGEQVISWHSKYIWDALKNLVKTDKDAIKLSNLMRTNLHYVLIVFSIIEKNGFGEFLKRFIHPEFSFFDYNFSGFNPKDGTFESFVKIERTGKNQSNNVDRFIRIAFAELKKYQDIENRKTKKWRNKKVDKEILILLKLLKDKKEIEAEKKLKEIFKLLAGDAKKIW